MQTHPFKTDQHFSLSCREEVLIALWHCFDYVMYVPQSSTYANIAKFLTHLSNLFTNLYGFKYSYLILMLLKLISSSHLVAEKFS